MHFNPKNLNLKQIYATMGKARPSEAFRSPIPGFNINFSEENPFEFNISKTKLQTYREKSKINKTLGLIIFNHGLNSHMGPMAFLADYFSKFGFECVGYDHRGFGKSEGLRGLIPSSEKLKQDGIEFLKLLDNLYEKEIPRFIIGESLGGLNSIQIELEMPENYLKGMILLAPALKLFSNFETPLKYTARTLNKIMPNLATVKSDSNKNSKNPEVCEDYFKDELRYSKGIRVSTINSILGGMDFARKQFANIKTNFIVIHGAKDFTVDVKGSVDLVEKAGSKKKIFIYCENLYHDVKREKEIFDILPHIKNFLLDNLS